MVVKLSFDEQKWLLKCYWKVENVVEVQRRWRVGLGILPPTRITITRIRDKFEVDGTVQDVLKGLSSRGLIGPYFFEETVMGQTYLQMLKIMIPYLNDLLENENEVYCQQVGAITRFMSI